MNYAFTLIALIAIYSILTLSTNLLIGYGGIVSMSQAAVFGIGAYTVAKLTLLGMSWWLALIPAIFLCMLANAILTIPALRASGFYFMVFTFAFTKIMNVVYTSWDAVTGGSYGLSGIPRANFFGITLTSSFSQMVLSLCWLAVCFLIVKRIMDSPYGDLVEAMRQEPTAVDALGKSTVRVKVINALFSGVFCAVAGGLYVQYISYIEAVCFNQDASYDLTIYVFLGGAATLMGSIAGPIFMLLIPRLIALLPLPPALTGPLQNLIYGILLVGFMMFRPGGLVRKKVKTDQKKYGDFARKTEAAVAEGGRK